MKRIAVFQHVAYEILGTLDPILRNAGFRIRYVNYARPHHTPFSMKDYDGLVVLGGPMAVWETDQHPHLIEELDHIKTCLAEDKPILGICLGAQLVACALKAKNYPSGVKEIGWHEVTLTEEGSKDPLFKHFKKTQKIFQWHGDTFDLPQDAVHLAKSEACQQQAYRYGDKVYGFQFHLEVDQPMIERWLQIPNMKAEAETLLGCDPIAKINADTQQNAVNLTDLANRTFSEFVSLFGTKNRRIVLGSGR